jgi:hypothetical protein
MRIQAWVVAGLTLITAASSYAKDTACTYGQNCLCDRVKKSGDALYNPNVLYCEDFEDPSLNNGDAVVYNDSYVSQFGADARYGDGWAKKYGPQSDNCMTKNLPAGYNIRPRGAEGTHPWSCINIVQENGCEVGNDCVFEGSSALAFRMIKGQANGIVGRASISQNDIRNFGVTIAMKVTSNYVSPKDPGNNGPAHKTDEWGYNDNCIMGCSTSNAGNPPWPFAAALKTFTSNPGGQVLRGVGEWDGSSGYRFGPTAADYNFDTMWGKGNWGCLQMKWTGWGSASAEATYWFNGKEIIHIKNLDMRTLKDNANGLSEFAFNAYYNGADGLGSGYTGASTAYRLEDNIVVTSGEPMSCNAIGLGTSVQAAPALGAPGQPQLLP